MAVAGSGVIPRKATLEARYSPRIAAAVANPLAGRGTQYRSRRTTPRSSHRTPAPGPIASGDAPNRTRAGCCFVVDVLPAAPRPTAPQIRRSASRHRPALRLPLAMQSSGRAAPRDCIRGIAQAGSAACPTVRRRQSNHAPGRRPATIGVIQMSPKSDRASEGAATTKAKVRTEATASTDQRSLGSARALADPLPRALQRCAAPYLLVRSGKPRASRESCFAFVTFGG